MQFRDENFSLNFKVPGYFQGNFHKFLLTSVSEGPFLKSPSYCISLPKDILFYVSL